MAVYNCLKCNRRIKIDPPALKVHGHSFSCPHCKTQQWIIVNWLSKELSLKNPIKSESSGSSEVFGEKMDKNKESSSPDSSDLTNPILIDGTKFRESLSQQKKERLINWRKKYDRKTYPLKLSENLLYEALTIIELWNLMANDLGWDDFKLFLSKEYDIKNLTDHSSLALSIQNLRREIAINKILPAFPELYKATAEFHSFNFSSFNEKAKKATESSKIEEIEFTYYYYTAAYEFIYAWMTQILIGVDKEEAFYNLSGVKIGEKNFDSLDELIKMFGLGVNLFYEPLDNF